MQGTWVQSLVQEDSTCCRATKPMHQNYWAHVLQPRKLCVAATEARVPGVCAPQQEKPPQWESCTPQQRSCLFTVTTESPCKAMKTHRSHKNNKNSWAEFQFWLQYKRISHKSYPFGLPKWLSGQRICLPIQEAQKMLVWSLDWGDPWRRRCQPLQYSCLENPTDRGAWGVPVHGVAKSWTQLSMHMPIL